MSSLETEAGIKRENTTVYAPVQIPLLNERRSSWLKTWLQRGKFRRKTKKPYKYQGYLVAMSENEPRPFEEAVKMQG